VLGPDRSDGTAIRFVDVSGGARIAVAESGRGSTLVKTATWLTQVDKDTVASPIWGHWVRELGARYHYVRYDPRGCGLSDRSLVGTDLSSLDLWIEDLRAVLDTIGDEPVALLGLSQGGPVAFGFAARYPQRVSHLVLYGTYACGMRRRGDPVQDAEAAIQVDLARIAWRTENERFRETFARQFVPDAGADEVGWFSEQLRTTTTPENAPLLESAFHGLDASELARAVRVPTLVLHATDDRGVPFEQGRQLAGLIPGARFVALKSRNHILLQRDIAFAQFLDEVERFLAS
jgi:pimeloyl-ACP methyl ester carboxylesterase